MNILSNDTLLGRPFNIVGYAALLHLFAKYARLNIGTFTLTTANTHVYTHHWDALNTQAKQYKELVDEVAETGNPMQYPQLHISDAIFDMSPEQLLNEIDASMFTLEGYNPKAAVSGRVTK